MKAVGDIHGYQVRRNSPSRSHLFFTDNSLFFKASKQECTSINNILSVYEHISGQTINFQKFDIYFSVNVPSYLRDYTMAELSITTPLNYNKYLGLPSLIGCSKRQALFFFKDRMWQRLYN